MRFHPILASLRKPVTLGTWTEVKPNALLNQLLLEKAFARDPGNRVCLYRPTVTLGNAMQNLGLCFTYFDHL